MEPNTWRIGRQKWDYQAELVFEAVWNHRTDEIVNLLLDQRTRLASYGLPTESERDLNDVDEKGPYCSILKAR
eukprot:5022499-Prorocentrum_lima.AAC.1